jgi:hypothetical protein
MALLPAGTLLEYYSGGALNSRDTTGKKHYVLCLDEIIFEEHGLRAGAVSCGRAWCLWNGRIVKIFCNITHLKNIYPPPGVEFDFDQFRAKIYP